MQDGQAPSPKQLLSERIKNATNILVTVSRDPSVDELSAALGLTLILNKLDKHATAVFSGKIPPAIEFLNPDKTFEGTVDSLRDFIIALDKEKADRLRYKVEDDVVRIFITPYRTTISDKDLKFSQGDFNVELVIALGVEAKEDLDTAITAHGRILHDATVATINATNHQSSLGLIDWTDSSASSYCEMLMSLSESLKSGVLDEQIATALLTGIVAATERFSNPKTSPKVMTMSAQLMAAGANQQLIATKLQEGSGVSAPAAAAPDGSKVLSEDSSEKLNQGTPGEEKKSADGEMHVEHEKPSNEEQAVEKAIELADSAEAQLDSAEAALDKVTDKPKAATATLSVEDLKKDLAAANEEVEQAAAGPMTNGSIASHNSDWKKAPEEEIEPLFGGTLNATTDEAHAAKEREDKMSRNHTILSHDEPSIPQAPLNSESPGAATYEPPSVDPFAEPPKSDPSSPMHYEPIDTHGATLQPLPLPPPIPVAAPAAEPVVEPVAEPVEEPAEEHKAPTLAELESQAHSAAAAANPVTDARAAVNAALDSLPFNPADEPLSSVGAQPLSAPSLHDDVAPAVEVSPLPPVGSTSPDLPSPPPLPDFSTLPPLPADPVTPPADAPSPTVNPVAPGFDQPSFTPPPSTSTDPGQFKLPGQS